MEIKKPTTAEDLATLAQAADEAAGHPFVPAPAVDALRAALRLLEDLNERLAEIDAMLRA